MFDAIVIGTGGIGSAVLYHLARRGARVVGLDRFPAAHDQGSSHGQTRIIRLAYFEHPDYVPLLRRAYELWADLEAEIGQRLYHEVGLLQAGPATGEVVPGVLRSADLHGLDVERLTARELSIRFPGFRVPDDFVGVFERRAGYLLVEDCVSGHLRAAERHGAQWRSPVSVLGWRRVGSEYLVETSSGNWAARRLIITAGPWASAMLPALGVPLRVLRKHLHWFATRSPAYRADQGGCTFLFELPEGVFYGFPQLDDDGVKVAEHTGGVVIDDPRDDPRQMDPGDRRRVVSFLGQCLPEVSQEPRRHAVCFYTMSPDGHFLVDRHPDDPGVLFAAGLSGHGFKFASVLGETLADLALEDRSRWPVEFLAAERPNWSR